MAKIFGLHLLRLRPDVDEEEFEKFVAEGLPRAVGVLKDAGWKPYLLKGDRGDRAASTRGSGRSRAWRHSIASCAHPRETVGRV